MFNRQVGFDQLMCLFEAGYKSEAEAGEALADAIKTGLVKREGGSFFLLPPRFTLNIDVFLAHFLEEKKRICGSRAYAISCWLTSHFMLC